MVFLLTAEHVKLVPMRQISIIAHNMRSAHNVGALLRTAEGLGVTKVYLTGYTPYPEQEKDPRLPHIYRKLHTQISKTALGAETTQPWEYVEDIDRLLTRLKDESITLVALEQTETAVPLPQYKAPERVALLLGEEVAGITKELLEQVTDHVVIPMYGHKESFNVVQAAAMALYHLRFN